MIDERILVLTNDELDMLVVGLEYLCKEHTPNCCKEHPEIDALKAKLEGAPQTLFQFGADAIKTPRESHCD